MPAGIALVKKKFFQGNGSLNWVDFFEILQAKELTQQKSNYV